MSKEVFRVELEKLINQTSMDSATNIADWILANMIEKYVEQLIYLYRYNYEIDKIIERNKKVSDE